MNNLMNLKTDLEIKESDNPINVLVALCHQVARAKGWWDVDSKPFPEFISLCHSELDESFDFVEDSANEGADRMDDHLPNYPGCVVELADTIIRVFDFVGNRMVNFEKVMKLALVSALGVPRETLKERGIDIVNDEPIIFSDLASDIEMPEMAGDEFAAFLVFLSKAHSGLSAALEQNRKGVSPMSDEVLIPLASTVWHCIFAFAIFFEDIGILEKIILDKLNYNLSRENRHGKKY